MAQVHHLGDAARVIFIGLDRPRRQEPLGVTRLDSDDRDAGLTKSAMKPFG
jgi:hypothetical protein